MDAFGAREAAAGELDLAESRDCVHRWFEAQAARTPDAIAIQYEGAQFSYSELDARANVLASHLIRLGVGPEVLVGLCFRRSLEIVVGILGILKAGGAYLPLDPDSPESRTRFILEDAKPKVLVTHTSLRDRLASGHAADVICVDTLDWERARAIQSMRTAVDADNLAYVIYTSGSTGRPKGTLVTHRNVLRLFRTTETWFGFGPNDVWTVFHSFAFDFSVWELWGALLYGGRAVIVPGSTARSPDTFRTLLRNEGVTVLCQTPSAFYPHTEMDFTGWPLRYVIFGGEELDFRRLKPWFERNGATAKLINMYGITETTVHATYYEISRDDVDSKSIIGVALPDLQIHILDGQRKPVPPGTIGEIYVGGPGVTRGYLNRPDLTAERFIRDPYSQDESARLYKSGDRARARPDGMLEFRGRADNQVKLRGYRIEPGEIEAALAKCDGVKQSAVVLQEGPSGEKELVAYIIGDGSAGITPAGLRLSLSKTLPAYMLPAAYCAIEAWPLTVNGKLDRAALPRPRRAHRVNLAVVSPRTQTETRVAHIWAQALAAHQVGIYDDFFELGGHSLSAARICARLRNAFDVSVAICELLSARNVAALAKIIDTGASRTDRQRPEPLTKEARSHELPTSFSEDLVLFFHELAPENLAYNNQVTVTFHGTLDVAALNRALSEIVRRHESLRTTFARTADGWRREIRPPWVVDLPVLDATPELLRTLFQHRFDPARLPLVLWTLVRVGPREHIFVHLEHHLVHDGWSFGVFMRELLAIYPAFREGRSSPLAELPIQFADFAIWQRNQLRGEAFERLLSYWRRKLSAPLPVLDLPTDKPRPEIQSFRGDEVQAELSLELAHAVRDFARTSGASLFSVMFAGFLALLRRYTGQDDIIVGSGFANRVREETEALIGMIVNMVPLRVNLAGNPPFVELVQRVQAVAEEALDHQELPFDLLVRNLNLPRDPSRNPLCQVAFNFHDSPIPCVRQPDLTAEIAYPHNGSAKFDMNVIVIPWAEQQIDRPAAERDQRISIKWDCNTDLFDLATVRQMLARYVRILDAATADPLARISEIPLVESAEQRRLLERGDNAQAYILDERREPVPEGIPGELYLRGDGLVRGHQNRSGQSADRFVVIDGRRLYRSGDRARYLPDGTIQLLESDHGQAKPPDQQPDLGTIEAALAGHPSVRHCVVQMRGTEPGSKRLVAYVVTKDASPIAPEVLHEFLRARLPLNMVPADYVAMNAAPRTPTERTLKEIWSKHLGHSDFGIEDDFFELGGHSLLAARVFSEITMRCGVSPPLSLLFKTPTIAALARAIDDGGDRSEGRHLIPVQPAGHKPPFFALLGIGGSYRAYAAIAKALGEDQPFYSFEMPGLEGNEITLERVEDIAERHLEEMRDVLTSEKCVLMGACAGALVVFELARLLTDRGRSVPLVIMLDPPPVGARRKRRLGNYRFWRRIVLLRFLLGRISRYLRELAILHGKPRRDFIKEKLSVLREILVKHDLLRASRREIGVTRVMEATSAALANYVPKHYDGRVVFLLGDRHGPADERAVSAEWRAVCTGPVETFSVPGSDTGSMFREPNGHLVLARLADLMKTC